MIALLRARAPAAGAARGGGGRSGRLLGVLALVEGAVGDPLEQLGVVAERADMVPGDLVGAVVEVIVAEACRRASIASISAFFCTKAASASSFDLVLVLRVLAIIFGLRLWLSER